MKVDRTLHVACSEGDLKISMGRALTSVSFKDQEKMVLRANEVDTLIALLQKGKEELTMFLQSVKTEEKQ